MKDQHPLYLRNKLVYLDNKKLYYYNDKELGDVVMDVDGFWKFFPKMGGGYWEPSVLREIADIMDELNREWEEVIQNDPLISGVS